ncbi:hypothetical protein FisN_30Lh088 [Fistulifera solaris]|uniref:Uncharacterized protein n=1 Tax=Fistulifera solaris TaxID=1519565 RepID=A0A1Z5JIF8_FISSO|nr:hypothetical protein FisN_30Lh088 [Fistulifera solaris]|eukprot:GAX13794.1 hypothetical protein FisN_30Lh088 [Fistulifera solaris]
MPGKMRFIPPIDDYSILSEDTQDAGNGRIGDKNKPNHDNNLLIRKKYSGDQTSVSSAESDGEYCDEQSHHHISDHSSQSDDNRSYNDGGHRESSNNSYSDQSYSKESHSNMSDSGQERSMQEGSIDVSETTYDDSSGQEGQQYSGDDSQDSSHHMIDDNSLSSDKPIQEVEDNSQGSGDLYGDDDAGSGSSRGQDDDASNHADRESNHSRGRHRRRDDSSSHRDSQTQNSYSQDNSRRGSHRDDDSRNSQISRSDQDDIDDSLGRSVTGSLVRRNEKLEGNAQTDPFIEHDETSTHSQSQSPLTESSIASSKADSFMQVHATVQDDSAKPCDTKFSHAGHEVSNASNPQTTPLHVVSNSKDNQTRDILQSNTPSAEEADRGSDEEDDDEAALRNKLEKLVANVMPEQLGNLDFLLEQFADREEELITALREMAANPRYSASNFDSSFSVTSTEFPDSDEENPQDAPKDKDDDSENSGRDEMHGADPSEDDEEYHSESLSSECDDNEDENDGLVGGEEASEELWEEEDIEVSVSRSSGHDDDGNDNEMSYTEEEVDETLTREEDQENDASRLGDNSNTGDGDDDHGVVEDGSEEVSEDQQFYEKSRTTNVHNAQLTETSYSVEEVDETGIEEELIGEPSSRYVGGSNDVCDQHSDHEADGALDWMECLDKSQSSCYHGMRANASLDSRDQEEENRVDKITALQIRRPVEENQEHFEDFCESTQNFDMHANACHNEAEIEAGEKISQAENDGNEFRILGLKNEYDDVSDNPEEHDGTNKDASQTSLNVEQDRNNSFYGDLGEVDADFKSDISTSIDNNNTSKSSFYVNIGHQVESDIKDKVADEKSSESQGKNRDCDNNQNKKDRSRDCLSVLGDDKDCNGASQSKGEIVDREYEYVGAECNDASHSVYDGDMTGERHEEDHSGGSASAEDGESLLMKDNIEFNDLFRRDANAGHAYRNGPQLIYVIDNQNDSFNNFDDTRYDRKNGYAIEEGCSQGSQASASGTGSGLESGEMDETIEDYDLGLGNQTMGDEDIEYKHDSTKYSVAIVIEGGVESKSNRGSSCKRKNEDVDYNGTENSRDDAGNDKCMDFSNNKSQLSLDVKHYETHDGTYSEVSDRERCNESVDEINTNENDTENGGNNGFSDSSHCIDNAHDPAVSSETNIGIIVSYGVSEAGKEYADEEDFYNNRTQSFRNTSNVHVNDEGHRGNTANTSCSGLSQFSQSRGSAQHSEPDNDCQSNSSFPDDYHDDPNRVLYEDNDESRGSPCRLDGEDEYEDEDQGNIFGDGHYGLANDYYGSDGSNSSGSSHGRGSESESKFDNGSFADNDYRTAEGVDAEDDIAAHDGEFSNGFSLGRNVDPECDDVNDDLDRDGTGDEHKGESRDDERDAEDYGGDLSQYSQNVDKLHEWESEFNQESRNKRSFDYSAPEDGVVRGAGALGHDGDYSDGSHFGRNVDDECDDHVNDWDHDDEMYSDGEVLVRSHDHKKKDGGGENNAIDNESNDGSQASPSIESLHESEPQFIIHSQNNDSFADEGCDAPDCDGLGETNDASYRNGDYSDGSHSRREFGDEEDKCSESLHNKETCSNGQYSAHGGDENDADDYESNDGSQGSQNIDSIYESELQLNYSNIQSQNNDSFVGEGYDAPECVDLKDASDASDYIGDHSDRSRPNSVNDDYHDYDDDGDIDESSIGDGPSDRGDKLYDGVTGSHDDAALYEGSDGQSTGSGSDYDNDFDKDASFADYQTPASYAGDAEVEGVDDDYSTGSHVSRNADNEDGDYNDDRNSGDSYDGEEQYNESESEGDDNDADDYGGYGGSDRSQSSHNADSAHESTSEPESDSDQEESQEDVSFADEEDDTAYGGHSQEGKEVGGRNDSNSNKSYSGRYVSDEYYDYDQPDQDEHCNDRRLADHDEIQYNGSDGDENDSDDYKGNNGSNSSHSIDNLQESNSEVDHENQDDASFVEKDQGDYADGSDAGGREAAYDGDCNDGTFSGRDVDDEDNDYDDGREYDETNNDGVSDRSQYSRSSDSGHESKLVSVPDNDNQDDGSFGDVDKNTVYGSDAEGEEVLLRDGDYNDRSFSGCNVDEGDNDYYDGRDSDETDSDATGSYNGAEQESEPRDYDQENDANSYGGSDGSQCHEFESESEPDNDIQNEGSFADEEYNAAYGGDTEEPKDITSRSSDSGKASQFSHDAYVDAEGYDNNYDPDRAYGDDEGSDYYEDHFTDFKNDERSDRSQFSNEIEDRHKSQFKLENKGHSNGSFVAESQVGDDAGEREVANHTDGYRQGQRGRGNYDSEDEIAQNDNGEDRSLARKAILESGNSVEGSVNSYQDRSARGDDEDSETSHFSQYADDEAKIGYNDATHAIRKVDYEYEDDSSYGDDEHSEPRDNGYRDGSQPIDNDDRYGSDGKIGDDDRSRSESQSASSREDESSSAHYSEGLYARHLSPGFDHESEALRKDDERETLYENDSLYDDEDSPTESDDEKGVPNRHAGNKGSGSGFSRSRNESTASDQFSGSWKKSEHSEYVMDFSASQEARESLPETDTEFFPAFDDYERPIHPSPAAEREHNVPNQQIQTRAIAYGGEKRSEYDDAGYSEEDYDYEYEKDYEASVEHAPSSAVRNDVKASFNRQDDEWENEKSYFNKQSSMWGIPLKYVILMLMAAIAALTVAIIVLSLRGPDTRVVTISSNEETNSTQATTLRPTTADSLSQSPVASPTQTSSKSPAAPPTASIAPVVSGTNVFTSGDTVISTSREPIEGTASNLSEKLCVQYLSRSQGYENACFSTEYNRNGLALRCQIEFDGIACNLCEICFGTNSTTNLPFIGFEANCEGLQDDETTNTCTLLDSNNIQEVLVDDVFSGRDIWAFAGEPPSSAPPPPTPRPSSSTTATPTPNPAPTKCFTSKEELVNAVDLYLLGDTLEYLEVTYGDEIGNWCFSGIQDLSELFSSNRIRAAASFNADLSNWDVSSVTNFTSMFEGASRFNADLSSWTVSNATTTTKMFSQASSFSSDLSTWSVASVTDMSGMFSWASSFNADLSDWDVSRVQSMEQMFLSASAFNQDLSSWQLDSIRSMKEMFRGCRFFAQNLCIWGEQLEGRTDVDTTQMFSLTQCEETEEVDWELNPPGPFCFECNSQPSYFEWDSLLDTSTQELLELAAPSPHTNVFDRAAE